MGDHVHDFSGGAPKCHGCGAELYAVATGAWTDGETPRAQTADEIRDRFMDTCRASVDFWAGDDIERGSVHERLSGLLHSLLCIFDGVSGGMPAFDLAASPHPDDKQYHQDEGENWIEPGTVINDCMLHELIYGQGLWRGRPLDRGGRADSSEART